MAIQELRELIIHCSEETDWVLVCKKIEKDYPNVKWLGIGKPPTQWNDWNVYRENSCLCVGVRWGNRLWYSPIEKFQNKYPNIPITTAKEFLQPTITTTQETEVMFDDCDYGCLWYYDSTGWTNTIITTDDEPKSRIIKNKKNKIMNVINNVFKSKENKALEYFRLGNIEQLTGRGDDEFLAFIFTTGLTDKKEFFKKIVEAFEEHTK